MGDKKNPKRYRARFIEPGVISYEDVGQGLVYVSRETLDRMRPSFIGMPVFNFTHKDVDAEQAFNLSSEERDALADGIVSDVGTDADGWDWAEMLVWDEKTQENIELNGFSVSCAYDILKTAGSGKRNGIEYDDEVTDGKYVHMAIVDSPRYNGSTIVLNAKGGSMWKWLGKTKKNAEPSDADKKAAADAAKAEEAKKMAAAKNAEDGEPEDGGEGEPFAVIDGEKVPISDLVKAYQAKENAGAEMAPDQEVDLGNGEKCLVSDLIAAYKGRENAEVEEPGTEADGPIVDNGTKKNAAKKEPANANFTRVKTAANKGAEASKPDFETRADRLKNGQSRYGSATAVSTKGGE